MAADVVISAEGLGKRYVIGHQAASGSYQSLRDVMARSARNMARSVRDLATGRAAVGGDETEEFWALRGVDFQIRRGEVMGVIGRNGAGKSTLLKVLSRITEPSEGRVTIKGRVASLLEVGTGFHPELSGRENIFLNGAILGMSRAEIRRKFDEIVAFAEVERFLDTPVKRYSSGMYVRLAFAVAAHLEPEILVVDEVLAVGDAEFQKKCLGKMQDVAGQGRTVLFVSHNMAAVRNLCSSGILLSAGRVELCGAMPDVITRYLQHGDLESAQSVDLAGASRKGDGGVRLSEISFPRFAGMHAYRVQEKVSIRFTLQADRADDMRNASVWFAFRNHTGDDVVTGFQKDCDTRFAAGGTAQVTVEVPMVMIPGRYTLVCGVLAHGGDVLDWIDDALVLEVEGVFADGRPFDSRIGLTTLDLPWSL